MIQLCKTHNIFKTEWSKFEELSNKYQYNLKFISLINAEAELDYLVSNDLVEV